MALEGYPSLATERDWQTVEDGTVRFALVGLGWWTQEFVVPALESASLASATVAVSSSREKADRLSSEVSSIETALIYEEFQEGEALDAYDAVYVCTPNATHLEYVIAAADHGKDVLCEKPMEATVERAERMTERCKGDDVTLMIAYRMHTEPVVRLARTVIERGLIGTPVLVRGQNAQPLLEMIDDPDQWRLDPDLSGYGTSVMDLGIYPLNTARFVLDSDPVRAQASMSSASEEFNEVPDERASFLVEFPENVVASCAASQNAHKGDRFTVIGTEGELSMRDGFHSSDRRKLELARGGIRTAIDVEPVDQMTEEFDYFADRVLRGERPHPDGEHGLVDMRALRAIYEAAERDEPVAIEA